MESLKKKLGIGLFIAAIAFVFASCDMLNAAFNSGSGDGEVVTKPVLLNIEPNTLTGMNAGEIYTIKFTCDTTDEVRISYQMRPAGGEDLEEYEYELIKKENGSFSKRIRVPLRAEKVQLFVTGSDGKYYVGDTWKVKGTKAYDTSFTAPTSYEKAESYRTNEPSALAVAITEDETLEATRTSDPLQYVIDVCERIKADTVAKDDKFLQAKIIHDILCLLIPYDMEGVNQDPMPPQDYWTCLKTTKAVCQGYAFTYQKFCEVIGIDCDYIYGWNRSATHAWNVIKIDGNAYLLDCTWDAGRAVDEKFNKNYVTEFMFVRPEIFVREHFPEFYRYQVLSNPVGGTDSARWKSTPQAFKDLPLIKPIYCDAIEDPSNNALVKLTGTVESADGKYSFTYKLATDEKYIDAVVRDSAGELVENAYAVEETEDGGNKISFSFPKAEKYKVRILLRELEEDDNDVCVEFYVNAVTASDTKYVNKYFPAITVAPVAETLKLAQAYDFRIVCSRAVEGVRVGLFNAEGSWSYITLNAVDEELKIFSKDQVTIPETITLSSGESPVAQVKIVVKENRGAVDDEGKPKSSWYTAAVYSVTESK